jgi:hypothetical protein
MHNEDAVGFTTARRFAPNRPYRVTFNGGVNGPGDKAYCQAAMPPAHLWLLRAGDGVHPADPVGGPPAAAGRSERTLSSGQTREITTDLVLMYACSASGPDSRP